MPKKQPATKSDDTPATLAELARLDRQLVELLSERIARGGTRKAGVAEGIAEDDARLAKLPGAPAAVRAALREVYAASRSAASPVRVAYLGPEHTFSHQAAVHRFGAGGDLAPVGSIAAVFDEVAQGASAFGVVPLENSTDGRVTDTLEAFARTRVQVCGELPLRVHHCLLGSGPRAGVRVVCSKPQALSQCRNWLAQHLPQAETRPVASTVEAARLAKSDPEVAAVASRQAGVHHGLAVLAAHIEDQPDNVTRFAIIGRQTAPKTGADKTALMFEVPHQPGSLADAMAIFKRQGLNMTWIESFPIPGSGGRYLFFVEFQGHQGEVRPRRAIAALGKKSTRLEVLGSYPQSDPID